jgi:hypothetical protein
VAQSEGGGLLGGGGIRGLLPAVSEAIRSGAPQELLTYLPPTVGDVGVGVGVAGGGVAVWCVPNRCVGPSQPSSCAAFVFHRPARSSTPGISDGPFSALDKDLLQSAANLASRVILHGRVSLEHLKYNSCEVGEMEVRVARAEQLQRRFQEVVSICERVSWNYSASDSSLLQGMGASSQQSGSACNVMSAGQGPNRAELLRAV